MEKIVMTAPAKINLNLNVTDKRSDGYHNLCTIMQSVSLCDTVYISKGSGGITVRCTDVSVPCDERNIACKAASEFFSYTGMTGAGADIQIDKLIPTEAGLGGGSADGAAVISGLDKLFGTGLSIKQLCQIGVNIGADVPFCIVGGTKLCRGIGEDISCVPPLESSFIVIAKGAGGISTKEAYQRIDSLAQHRAADISLYDGTIGSLKKIGGNIFEEITENNDVFRIKQICTDFGAEYTAMSGSGSAVFGLFGLSRPKSDAQSCAYKLISEGFFADVCIPLPYGAKNSAQ